MRGLRLFGLPALSAAALLASVFTVPAHAATLDVFCVTGNNAGDCAIGEAQLSIDALDIGGGQVNFRFNNAGAAASSISEVYFDDGALFGLSTVTHSAGESWTGGSASPGNLPGGNMLTPPFVATQGFVAESNPPPPQNGVNPGEFLDVVFDLQTGMSFADVLNDLNTGDLRVGMHVISFASGGSESFVNNPVPLPAAVWLFGSGLLGLVGVARRCRS